MVGVYVGAKTIYLMAGEQRKKEEYARDPPSF
jgi:hypothetical protein